MNSPAQQRTPGPGRWILLQCRERPGTLIAVVFFFALVVNLAFRPYFASTTAEVGQGVVSYDIAGIQRAWPLELPQQAAEDGPTSAHKTVLSDASVNVATGTTEDLASLYEPAKGERGESVESEATLVGNSGESSPTEYARAVVSPGRRRKGPRNDGRLAYATTFQPGNAETLGAVLALSGQLNSTQPPLDLIVLVNDTGRLSARERAQLEGARNVDLVDVASVYDLLFLNTTVPLEFQRLKRGLYSYARFRETFEGRLRLLLWLLWDRDVIAYVNPKTIFSSDEERAGFGSLFGACPSSATLCAPGLYQPRCEATGNLGQAAAPDQDLFNPRVMVLRPDALAAKALLEVVEAARMSENTEILSTEANVLLTGLSGSPWRQLPPCYSDLVPANTTAADAWPMASPVAREVFEGTVKIVQGSDGDAANAALNLTSAANRLYSELRGFGYGTFTGRVLNSTRFTSHWDRYAVLREELRSGWDYVAWMDSDAMVKDLGVDLRQAISAAGEGADIIIGADWESRPKDVRPFPPVNTGMMVWRNTNWTLDFLDGFLDLELDYCKKCAER